MTGRTVSGLLLATSGKELSLAIGPRIQHVPRSRIRAIRVEPSTLPETVPSELREEIERAIAQWQEALHQRQADPASHIEALGVRAFPALAAMTLKTDPGKRACLEGLARHVGRVGGHCALETLARLLRAKEEPCRYAAVEGLAAMKWGNALPLLLLAVEDPSGRVNRRARRAVVELARELPTLDVVREIKKQAQRSRGAHRQVALLGEMATPEAVEGLRDLLFRGEEARSVAVLAALGRCGNAADGEKVLDRFKRCSPRLQKEACLFFGRLKHRPAIPLLIATLDESDRAQARNAHWALKRITGVRLKGESRLWKRWWMRARLVPPSDRRSDSP